MENVIVVGVTDAADGVANDFFVVHLGIRGDLTADDDDVGFHKGFTGYTAGLVLRKAGIEDGV